jgi:S1-C subfamily serine protease
LLPDAANRPPDVRLPTRHSSRGRSTPPAARIADRAAPALALLLALLLGSVPAPAAAQAGAASAADPFGAAALCGTLPPGDDAVDACARAVRGRPGDLALRLRHAAALADAGRVRAARDACRDAIRLAPDSAEPYFAAAGLARRDGDVDAAIALYEAFAARTPDDATGPELAGWLLLERGAAERALRAFRDASRRQRASAGGAHGAGVALQRLGRHEEAVRQLRAAVQVAPGNSEAWGALAGSALALGRDRDAAAYWERALAIDAGYFDRRTGERRRWQTLVRRVGQQPPASLEPVVTALGAPLEISPQPAESLPARRGVTRLPRSPIFVSSGSTGSGLAVSRVGHVLTNRHVVRACTSVRVRGDGARPIPARVVAIDGGDDLALLLAESTFPVAATFRAGAEPRPGEDVVAVGYPLNGLLADQVHVTTGAVNALAGLYNDAHELTVSAPVQPGNSGGPLLDGSGHVVGIVVTKLNARVVAETTGDLPQNVNFAIKAAVVRDFLAAHGVDVASAASTATRSHADVGDVGRRVTLLVECVRAPK